MLSDDGEVLDAHHLGVLGKKHPCKPETFGYLEDPLDTAWHKGRSDHHNHVKVEHIIHLRS